MKVKNFLSNEMRNESEFTVIENDTQSSPFIDRSEYFFDRFEYELICWDPKDGELWVSRMKSEETLMEVRSDVDVQIARQTCL